MGDSVESKIHDLCCANTHVHCEAGRTDPQLKSYDQTVFPLRTSTDIAMNSGGVNVLNWLSNAYSKVCGMSMARNYGDCVQPCPPERKAKSQVVWNQSTAAVLQTVTT